MNEWPQQAAENNREIEDRKKKLLEFRFKQSMASRLAEYITGLRPDDPKMANRLIEDQKIIRAKYGLPDRGMRYDSQSEYERFLRGLAKKRGLVIRDKSECSKYFDESIANAVHIEDTRSIAVGIDRNSPASYAKGLGELEHEFIHAEQVVRYKNMSAELCEYEAYVAGLKVDLFKEKPEDIEGVLFGFFIAKSLSYWYDDLNKKNRARSIPEVKPAWRDPKYFLRNVDHIDQVEIDKHQKAEDDAQLAQYMEENPDKFESPKELRECEPEIAEFEEMIATFEAKHSLTELHSIVNLTPGELACYALQVKVSPEKLALLADPTSEDVSRYLVRKTAREALNPIVAKMSVLKEETNISSERHDELKARYKCLARAVGIISNDKVDHER